MPQLLQFIVYTAVRSSEARLARWDEINWEERVWTIPADRMKTGKAHRVPLTAPAMISLTALHAAFPTPDVIFPSQHGGLNGRSIGSNAVLHFLDRLSATDGGRTVTIHGFRSTFSDRATKRTSFAREVREIALAHSVGNAVEQAYRRGDLFENRRKLMAGWAAYLGQPAAAGTASDVPINERRSAA